jgi:hypothetical protein
MADTAAPRIRILGGRVVARAQDGNSRNGLVAIIDVRVGPFVLFGCRLYRRRDRTMTFSAPEIERTDGNTAGIRIEAADLKAELLTAACGLARMLGASVDPIEPGSTEFAELAGALKERSESETDA